MVEELRPIMSIEATVISKLTTMEMCLTDLTSSIDSLSTKTDDIVRRLENKDILNGTAYGLDRDNSVSNIRW